MLRAFVPDDRDAFALVLQNEQTMAAWGGAYGAERVDMELRHYLEHDERYGFAPFAVWLGDQLIGEVDQRPADAPSPDVRVSVGGGNLGDIVIRVVVTAGAATAQNPTTLTRLRRLDGVSTATGAATCPRHWRRGAHSPRHW